MIGVTEAAAAATVLGSARKFLRQLQQSNLADTQRTLVDQAMEVVNDGQERLSQLQARIFELQQENQTLRDQLKSAGDWNSRLTAFEQFQTSVGGVVLRKIGSNPPLYACPRCAESKKELHPLNYDGELAGSWGCKNCDNHYDVHKPERPYSYR